MGISRPSPAMPLEPFLCCAPFCNLALLSGGWYAITPGGVALVLKTDECVRLIATMCELSCSNNQLVIITDGVREALQLPAFKRETKWVGIGSRLRSHDCFLFPIPGRFYDREASDTVEGVFAYGAYRERNSLSRIGPIARLVEIARTADASHLEASKRNDGLNAHLDLNKVRDERRFLGALAPVAKGDRGDELRALLATLKGYEEHVRRVERQALDDIDFDQLCRHVGEMDRAPIGDFEDREAWARGAAQDACSALLNKGFSVARAREIAADAGIAGHVSPEYWRYWTAKEREHTSSGT